MATDDQVLILKRWMSVWNEWTDQRRMFGRTSLMQLLATTKCLHNSLRPNRDCLLPLGRLVV